MKACVKHIAKSIVIEINNPLLMITKEELLEGLELLYTGKAFTGFKEENPFVTFLGYDKRGWSRIWVKYGRRKILTSLKDLMLKRDTISQSFG